MVINCWCWLLTDCWGDELIKKFLLKLCLMGGAGRKTRVIQQWNTTMLNCSFDKSTNLFWINWSTKFYQADYDAMQIYRESDLINFCFDKSLQPIGVTDERLWQKLRQLVDFLTVSSWWVWIENYHSSSIHSGETSY